MTLSEKVRGFRIATYLAALLFMWFVSDGYVAHVTGGAVTLVALLLYWLEQPRFFRLAMMWCAGYLLIITGEGLLDARMIVAATGWSAYEEASRYMVTAHFVALLGHDIAFSESAVRPSVREATLRVATVLPLLVVSSVVALVHFGPLVVRMYTQGRARREAELASVSGALLQGVAVSASVAVPILAVWCARRVRGTPRTLLFVLAAAMMIVQFVVGIRFLLLFSTMGAAIVWLAPRRPSRRVLLAFVAVALSLWMVSTLMRKTRTFGLEAADVGAVVTETGADDLVLNEGVVKMMALAVTYTRLRGYTDGESSAAILVFWVPRTLWAAKPTFMGHWLPRFFSTQGIPQTYSSAQGFAADAYVDFGFIGGVSLWLLLGLLFGALERRIAEVCAAQDDARVIFAAPVYGATFFAVRTLDTTIMVMLGVLLFLIFVFIVAGSYRRPT